MVDTELEEVYCNVLISIRIIAPGNRYPYAVLHFGGVVLDSGHFVDAACGYSTVGTYRSVFRTGAWERRVILNTRLSCLWSLERRARTQSLRPSAA